MNADVIEAAARAYVDANDHAHCRKRRPSNSKVYGRDTYEGETADDILRRHGVTFDEPRTWMRYMTAAVHRAGEIMGKPMGSQVGKHGNQRING